MKSQSFFYYQLTVDLNDMHCIPRIITGTIVKENKTTYIGKDEAGHDHWMCKSIFEKPFHTIDHTPGDIENMKDEGYDTYAHGYLWLGEKTDIEEAICHSIVKRINDEVKEKINARVQELLKNSICLDAVLCKMNV